VILSSISSQNYHQVDNYTCSIVIPFYKRHETIRKAISSALELPFIEDVIIVDDDPFPELNHSFFLEIFNELACASKIKVIKNTMYKGAQGARVCGADYSNSDLILFLDSDDELIKSGCIALYEELCNSAKIALVYSNVYFEEGCSDFLRLEGFAFDIVLKNLSLCPFSGLMVRKSMVSWDKLDLLLPAWQDDDFILTVSSNNQIKFIDSFSSKMYLSNNSISKSKINQLIGLSMLLKKWKTEIVSQQGYHRFFLWKLRQLRLLLLVLSDRLAVVSSNTCWMNYWRLLLSNLISKIANKLLKLISPFFDRIYA
jgi:glycosyltransferase involved in cell wall biosynthesis